MSNAAERCSDMHSLHGSHFVVENHLQHNFARGAVDRKRSITTIDAENCNRAICLRGRNRQRGDHSANERSVIFHECLLRQGHSYVLSRTAVARIVVVITANAGR